MALTESLLLPPDVVIAKVTALPEGVRSKLESSEDDYVITRPRVRTPSSVIDASAAQLLEQFRAPSTVPEAVLRYCVRSQLEPARVLEDAYPLLARLHAAGVLVSAARTEAHAIGETLRIGQPVGDFTVLAPIQVLEDTEIHQVRGSDGTIAALKIARALGAERVRPMLAREHAILARLEHGGAPRCLADGELDGRPYLVLEWCAGVSALTAADHGRSALDGAERARLHALCANVLDAYARLHEQGVVHGDVHPGNVLVDGDSSARVIDFGFSRILGEADYVMRGGVGFFYEPELARATLERRTPPVANLRGEQYAVAALVFRLLTGSYYVDFSLDADTMMRQVAETAPASFESLRLSPWPEVEAVLARALAKDPDQRYASTADFARAWREIAPALRTHTELATPRAVRDALESAVASFLERVSPGGELFESGFQEAPLASVNLGSGGIAFALYRLALAREEPRLLALADAWLARSRVAARTERGFCNPDLDLPASLVGLVSPHHGEAGLHYVHAHLALARGEDGFASFALEAFAGCVSRECESSELMFGRAGVLLALANLLHAQSQWRLREFGDAVMARLWADLDAFAPIGECEQLHFLGLAHGWGGVLYATLRWCEASGARLPNRFDERLAQLAAHAEPFGRGVRFRRVVSPSHPLHPHDYVPGWCNGSAGLAFLWFEAQARTGDPRHAELAERCAWMAWEHGDVHGDLCCGVAGRAYALLAAHRATGDDVWLARACELGRRAISSIRHRTLRRDSLYKGEPGVAVLAADLLVPEHAAMPFFETEWRTRAAKERPAELTIGA